MNMANSWVNLERYLIINVYNMFSITYMYMHVDACMIIILYTLLLLTAEATFVVDNNDMIPLFGPINSNLQLLTPHLRFFSTLFIFRITAAFLYCGTCVNERLDFINPMHLLSAGGSAKREKRLVERKRLDR